MKSPFNTTPLSGFPYNSRLSKTEFSSMLNAKNYVLHGFKPGNALQASELNEIQENFYKQLTLHNLLLKNWLFIGSSSFTSGNGDPIYGPSWVGAVPLHPFKSINIENGVLTLKKDWYLIDDYSGLKFWIYNNTTRTVSINLNDSYISVKIEKKYITPNEDDGLYDNSGGFSNSTLSPGADRYQLDIIDIIQSTVSSGISTNFRDMIKITDSRIRYLNNLVHTNE